MADLETGFLRAKRSIPFGTEKPGFFFPFNPEEPHRLNSLDNERQARASGIIEGSGESAREAILFMRNL